MKIILDSPINKYYVQTLGMIFFPGEHFAENEELSDRYFAKYTDAVASILQSTSKASPIKDRYGLY